LLRRVFQKAADQAKAAIGAVHHTNDRSGYLLISPAQKVGSGSAIPAKPTSGNSR
jgi:hypothetical protein